MKKHIIAGLALAIIGTAGAVAGAYSAYKKNADDIEVSIGARTTKDVKYVIGETSWGAGGYKKLAPGVNNTLGFTIGGEAVAGGIYTQDVIVGKLGFEISSTNDKLINYLGGLNLTATVNYATVNDNKPCWWAKEHRNEVHLAKDTESGKLIGSTELAVAMDSSNTVALPINIPSELDKSTMLSIAESTFNIHITWQETTNFDFAYVCGTMETCSWDKVDEWRMVPMINTEDFEWKYILDATHKAYMVEGAKFKAHNGAWSGAFVPGDSGLGVDDDGNAVVTAAKAGKVKGIYWKGGDNAITVDATE